MADSFEFKLQGLDNVLDILKGLPPEIAKKNVARAALRKGAVVIQKQAKANFREAVNLPGKTGITDSTGFTEKQIAVKYKRPNGVKGVRYILTVNYKDHPRNILIKRKSRRSADSNRRQRKRTERPIKANDIAFIMEYGSSKQAATPWLRPAFASRAEEAIRTVERELSSDIDKIVNRLARR